MVKNAPFPTPSTSLVKQISELSSPGAGGGSPQFVVTGATVKCKEGEKEAHLVKTSFGNLDMGGAIGLTKDDKEISEGDFGDCKKLTKKHKDETGEEKKIKCKPDFTEWSHTESPTTLLAIEALTMNSKLTCSHASPDCISIFDGGQGSGGMLPNVGPDIAADMALQLWGGGLVVGVGAKATGMITILTPYGIIIATVIVIGGILYVISDNTDYNASSGYGYNYPNYGYSIPSYPNHSEEFINDYRSAITNSESNKLAKDLGYKKTNEYTRNGKPIYKNNKAKGKPKYISPDRDEHNGGVWKGADNPKDLNGKKSRSGTYDKDLNKIGD